MRRSKSIRVDSMSREKDEKRGKEKRKEKMKNCAHTNVQPKHV